MGEGSDALPLALHGVGDHVELGGDAGGVGRGGHLVNLDSAWTVLNSFRCRHERSVASEA